MVCENFETNVNTSSICTKRSVFKLLFELCYFICLFEKKDKHFLLLFFFISENKLLHKKKELKDMRLLRFVFHEIIDKRYNLMKICHIKHLSNMYVYELYCSFLVFVNLIFRVETFSFSHTH